MDVVFWYKVENWSNFGNWMVAVTDGIYHC